jgi:hypothetical protein
MLLGKVPKVSLAPARIAMPKVSLAAAPAPAAQPATPGAPQVRAHDARAVGAVLVHARK